MLRVCAPDGVVAARDADYAAMTWYPADPRLDRWLAVYRAVAHGNGGRARRGPSPARLGQRRGAAEVTASASVWCYATPEARAWWGGMWADRILTSAITAQAVEGGTPTRRAARDLRGMAGVGRAGRRLVRDHPRRRLGRLLQSEISGTGPGVDTRPSGMCLLDARETVTHDRNADVPAHLPQPQPIWATAARPSSVRSSARPVRPTSGSTSPGHSSPRATGSCRPSKATRPSCATSTSASARTPNPKPQNPNPKPQTPFL